MQKTKMHNKYFISLLSKSSSRACALKLQYLPLPNTSLPTASPKGNYGPVLLEPVLKLLDTQSPFVVIRATGDQPKTFEALSVNQGFVLYETNLPPSISDPAILQATIKDRALIYVDNQLRGILSRIDKIFTIPLESPYGHRLSLLVENQGRLNFGNEINDSKVSRKLLKLLE